MKKKVIIIIAIIVVVLIAGGYVAFEKTREYVGNKVINQILNSGDISEKDIAAAAKRLGITLPEGTTAENIINGLSNDNNSAQNGSNTNSEKSDKNGNNTQNNSQSDNKTDGKNDNAENASSGEQPQIRAGSFWNEPLIKDIYGRFSASEIASLTSKSLDGLSKEEKKEIKDLVYSRVSTDEISEAMALYKLYTTK